MLQAAGLCRIVAMARRRAIAARTSRLFFTTVSMAKGGGRSYITRI
jgi:hypothetical protein